MYQQFERLKFLLSRCLSSCNASGSSKQYIKIDNLPKVMGDGASINVNQVSVIVNQLKIDLNECAEIAEDLKAFIPNNKSLPMIQAVNNYKLSMCTKTLTSEGGNQSKSAQKLGMNRTTLVAFMDKQLPEWRDGL